MIKANELRIGNWVDIYTNLNMGSKKSIRRDIIKQGAQLDNNNLEFEGIPLTPEILEKAGFKSCDNGVQLKTFEGYVFINWLFAGKSSNVSEGTPLTLEIDGNRMPLFKVQFLHQLQNLYFALTGEELNIDL